MSVTVPVEIVIHPELLTSYQLADLLERCSDFSPVLLDIGDIIEQELSENFLTQGYGSWTPLKDSTKRDRYIGGFSGRPDLIRTGALFEGLTERGAPGHKFLVSPNSISVGVYGDVVPYAHRLAVGDAHMPGRVLVNLGPDGVERIIKAIQEWLGADVTNGVSVYAEEPIGV